MYTLRNNASIPLCKSIKYIFLEEYLHVEICWLHWTFPPLESTQSITGGCGHSECGHQHPGEPLWWPAQPAQWRGETHINKYTHTHACLSKLLNLYCLITHDTQKVHFFLFHVESHLHKHVFSCPPMYTDTHTHSHPRAHAHKHTNTHRQTHTCAETCQSIAMSPPHIINDCSTCSSDCGCLK